MAVYSSNVVLRRDAGFSVIQFALMQGLVASLVAPDLMVEDKVGQFKKLTARSIAQTANTKASNKGAPNIADLEIDQDTYACEKHWLDIPVTDTEAAELQSSFPAREIAARVCGMKLLLQEEIDLASLLFNTTTWPLTGTTGLSVSTPWATAATATPIDDVQAGAEAILKKTGCIPDTLLLTFKGLLHLSRCSQIIERLKYVSMAVTNGVVANPDLAAVLGIKRIVVASAVYNSADAGQTMSGGYVWNTDNAMLMCSAPMQRNPQTGMLDAVPAGATPQLARTLCWTGEVGGPMDAYPVRDDDGERFKFRTKRCRVQKVLDSNFGFLLGNLD